MSLEVLNSDVLNSKVFNSKVFNAVPSVRPSSTVPPLSIELAAQEEAFLLRRDSEIARCFGCSAAHITRKRQENKSSWDAFERRWLAEGPKLLAQTQKRQAAFAAWRVRQAQDVAFERALFRRNHERQRRENPEQASSAPSHTPQPARRNAGLMGRSAGLMGRSAGLMGRSAGLMAWIAPDWLGWLLIGLCALILVAGQIFPEIHDLLMTWLSGHGFVAGASS